MRWQSQVKSNWRLVSKKDLGVPLRKNSEVCGKQR
jgi:hypothetical protein